MSDYPGALQIISELFETRFGGWQQPDAMDPCRVGLGGCPVLWTSGYELRKVTVGWERAVGLTPAQDAAMCTFHFLNLTGGDPDSTWTTTDYGTVETAIGTAWNAIRGSYAPDVKLTTYTWRADGPAFRPFGTSLSPTLRVQTGASPGTSASQGLPPQVAVSVTEVVPATFVAHDVEGVGDQTRNRWGRFYLPSPAISVVTAGGRLNSTFSALVASSFQTAYNTCVAADLVPVVYSPTTGKAWSLDALHVDDIVDVVRSRRYRTPLTRNVVTIDAP